MGGSVGGLEAKNNIHVQTSSGQVLGYVAKWFFTLHKTIFCWIGGVALHPRPPQSVAKQSSVEGPSVRLCPIHITMTWSTANCMTVDGASRQDQCDELENSEMPALQESAAELERNNEHYREMVQVCQSFPRGEGIPCNAGSGIVTKFWAHVKCLRR